MPCAPNLPAPPAGLSFGEVALRFAGAVAGDEARGFVPYYHFRIIAGGVDVGHINFRIGDSEHVRLAAGHIGFEVLPPYRGHRYALQACRALAPFVGAACTEVLITCDPDNGASRRTIEHLGARFIDVVAVPAGDPHYQRGSRIKRRYRWAP
jgi:tagatose 1,6-diphosphate aldolase